MYANRRRIRGECGRLLRSAARSWTGGISIHMIEAIPCCAPSRIAFKYDPRN